MPWMDDTLHASVENFRLVLDSRFPSLHDQRTRPWGKLLGRVLSRRRWEAGDFADPALLRAVRRWSQLRPSDSQVIEPVNTKGLNRWVKYRPYFEKALPILEPMLRHWDYSA